MHRHRATSPGRTGSPCRRSWNTSPASSQRSTLFHVVPACHGMQNKIVGPGFNEIAAKYKAKPDLEAYLVKKIITGGSGVWGSIPMPPQTQLKDADAKAIALWLSTGAK